MSNLRTNWQLMIYLRYAAKYKTLDKQPMPELAAWCQVLGQSGRGTRKELVERLKSLLKGK